MPSSRAAEASSAGVLNETAARYGIRVARWDKAMEWPLTVAAVIFLVAYSYEILADPEGVWATATRLATWVTWGLFCVDYVVRLTITEHRWRWFYRHLLDLAIVVLPILRPLRLMRFFTILAIIQRGAGAKFRGRVTIYIVGATIITIFAGALAVYDAEHRVGNITSFGDALWWAFVTITTVGYGDFTPVTFAGRLVAVGLMLGGIALIGMVSATLASWIVERVSDETTVKEHATQNQVEELRAEIAELKDMIRDLRPTPSP
ncbi:ion channel [Microbacterium sp. X-17]|uniref:potassium channel family protein n=1 Tax=Microbacterium sp. X-17 TaxID=3144404 RepID=UPI0031F4BF10